MEEKSTSPLTFSLNFLLLPFFFFLKLPPPATMAMLAGTDFSTSQFGGGGFLPSCV